MAFSPLLFLCSVEAVWFSQVGSPIGAFTWVCAWGHGTFPRTCKWKLI